MKFEVVQIGQIERDEIGTAIKVDDKYREGLMQLSHFSHVIVFWWADRYDNDESRTILSTEPPYAKGKKTGVFACRSEYRPNPLMMTICAIKKINEKAGVISVGDIDAIDGTPVLDLKAYFPVCDRVKEAHIPEWLSDWPEWMPANGIGIM